MFILAPVPSTAMFAGLALPVLLAVAVLATGKETACPPDRAVLPGHPDVVTGVAVSPDGKTAATAGGIMEGPGRGKVVGLDGGAEAVVVSEQKSWTSWPKSPAS
jgi:hypothetical protein